jgi:hypothetical protein
LGFGIELTDIGAGSITAPSSGSDDAASACSTSEVSVALGGPTSLLLDGVLVAEAQAASPNDSVISMGTILFICFLTSQVMTYNVFVRSKIK